MSQLALLPMELEVAAEAKKRTYRDDPITSLIAAREMVESGAISAQQREVLGALRRFPGLTSDELAARARLDRYAVARRLSELAALGVASRGARKRSSISNRQGVSWRPEGK